MKFFTYSIQFWKLLNRLGFPFCGRSHRSRYGFMLLLRFFVVAFSTPIWLDPSRLLIHKGFILLFLIVQGTLILSRKAIPKIIEWVNCDILKILLISIYILVLVYSGPSGNHITATVLTSVLTNMYYITNICLYSGSSIFWSLCQPYNCYIADICVD